MISITFPFAPVAWQRVARSKSGYAYVPEKTRRYKQDIKLWASKQIQKPLEGPIKITMVFYATKPIKPSKSYPRGDIDNYQKAIQDALNGVAFLDDSQIVHVDAKKSYDHFGDGKTTLSIESLS